MMYFSKRAAFVSTLTPDQHSVVNSLSLITSTGLGNVLADYSAVAGYLSLSIPMISWMIISASGGMMAGLAGRILDGYDNQVSSAAEQASSGNVNLGQLQYENSGAFQSNSSPSNSSGFIQSRNEWGSTNRNYIWFLF
jgi:hypothetical protein